MRIIVAFPLALLAACSHQLSPARLSDPPDPAVAALAFVADSMTGGTFPQISDSTRLLAGGAVRAASDAPVCSLDLEPDAAGWNEVQTPIQSRYLKAVAVRLPPGFTPAWYSRPRDPDDDAPEEPTDSSQYWGHMLGSWDRFNRDAADNRPSGFTVWIGPEEGYPTSFVGGAYVRQVAFSECRVDTALGRLPVALFAVESPQSMLGGYYVVSYAQLQPGVYIQAMGTAPDSSSRSALLTALSTIRAVR